MILAYGFDLFMALDEFSLLENIINLRTGINALRYAISSY